jgi:Mg2+/citrate symporter
MKILATLWYFLYPLVGFLSILITVLNFIKIIRKWIPASLTFICTLFVAQLVVACFYFAFIVSFVNVSLKDFFYEFYFWAYYISLVFLAISIFSYLVYIIFRKFIKTIGQ